MVTLDAIRNYLDNAGPDLRKVYVTAVCRGRHKDLGSVVIEEGEEGEESAFRLFDMLKEYQEKLDCVILDGRGVKGARCKYQQVKAEKDDADGTLALVEALERQSRASVEGMSAIVEGNKTLVATIRELTQGTMAAMKQTAEVVQGTRDLFVAEVRAAREEAAKERERMVTVVREKHEAEIAFVEAEAEKEGTKESVWEFYMKNPDKIAAAVTLLKSAGRGLLTEGVKTAAKVG